MKLFTSILAISVILLAGGYYYVQQASASNVVVYKSATCSCCEKWVDHMKSEGFQVKVHVVEDVGEYKTKYGVPGDMSSCHTATVGGYFVEGHVPASDVKKLLSENSSAVKGLAVPGMPVGSPGMEVGDRKDPYNVMAINKDGSNKVFSSY